MAQSSSTFATRISPPLLLGFQGMLVGGLLLLGFLGQMPQVGTSGVSDFSDCASCHASETEAWTGSHHDLAMEKAIGAFVRAPFDGEVFSGGGEHYRFFREDETPRVEIEEDDGTRTVYEISDVFGWEPLQQYLIEGAKGRKQVLPVSWDARSKEEGGERWFHLYEDESLARGDPFHWSGRHQVWNTTCAYCHSTDFRRNYDAESGTFQSTVSQIDVGCGSCHVPGDHPTKDELSDEHETGYWALAEGSSTRHWEGPERAEQIDRCAGCHSRRSEIGDGAEVDAPFLDHFQPALIEPRLYHLDGQIEEEVYVYGSFLQSKMHGSGVQCLDCHEPHSLKLRAEGNALCGQCHVAEVFDTPRHHGHEVQTASGACVSCHMPSKTYMGVDERRDHFFRVPNPKLSKMAGSPDVCTGCHGDKELDWAIASFEGKGWASRGDAFAEGLALMETKPEEARQKFLSLRNEPGVSAMRLASALYQLGVLGDHEEDLTAMLEDPRVLVRLGALRGLGAQSSGRQNVGVVARQLDDPIRALRYQAVWTLLPRARQLQPAERARLDEVAGALRADERLKAERSEALLNVSLLESHLGNREGARRALENALRLDPSFSPARVNLAEILWRSEGEAAAQALLREGLLIAPEDDGLLLSLALSEVRAKNLDGALELLERAARARPENPTAFYYLASAYSSKGDKQAQYTALERGLERHPADRNLLLLGLSMARTDGEKAQHGIAYLAAHPRSPMAYQVQETLVRMAEN